MKNAFETPPEVGQPTDPGRKFAAERAALLHEWSSGYLQPYVPHLRQFVDRRRHLIAPHLTGRGDHDAVVRAVKRLIIQARSVDQHWESQDQIKAINDEIWYQGERQNYDRAAIIANWIRVYAPQWRRWRLREYIFLAQTCVYEITIDLRLENSGGNLALAGAS